MTVVAVGSLRGSPGATTCALDLARCLAGDTLLIEADPDGGCLAARLDLGLRPGLTELAGAARVGISAEDLWRYAQPTANGTSVIVAHPAAEPVQAALRAAVHHVGRSLASAASSVVIDVGRLRPGSPALGFASLADQLVIVSDNGADAIVALTHRAQLLEGLAPALVLLTSGEPYRAGDVAAATRRTVFGVLPRAVGRRATRRRAALLGELAVMLTAASNAPFRPGLTNASAGPTTVGVAP